MRLSLFAIALLLFVRPVSADVSFDLRGLSGANGNSSFTITGVSGMATGGNASGMTVAGFDLVITAAVPAGSTLTSGGTAGTANTGGLGNSANDSARVDQGEALTFTLSTTGVTGGTVSNIVIQDVTLFDFFDGPVSGGNSASELQINNGAAIIGSGAPDSDFSLLSSAVFPGTSLGLANGAEFRGNNDGVAFAEINFTFDFDIASSGVPEPSSSILMLSALCSALGFRRRRGK